MQPNNIHQFRHRQPMVNIPIVVIVLVLINIAIFILQRYFLDRISYNEFLYNFAFVPEIFGMQLSPKVFLTTITYSFLHGSWSHVGMNMIFLIIYGSPLARRIGASGFIVFWMFMAVFGVLFYYIFNLSSSIPVVGASAVVSAMLGAVARFGYGSSLLNPVLYGNILPIRTALRSREIIIVMGFWVLINLFYGFSASLYDNAIAWQAHIGGLIAGFLGVGFFIFPKK